MKTQMILKKILKKKIIFLLIVFLLFFVLINLALAKKCSSDNDCQQVSDPSKRTLFCREGKCVRGLEIVYPPIPGQPVPSLTAGLPDYVKYIFTFSVIVFGLVIFGVLIYNGILYLTSVGNPVKMKEAQKSILYGFLGGLLLLGAYLIFNTINPQLTIMELPKTPPLEVVDLPGVYICNTKISNIEQLLNDYVGKKGEEQIEAGKKLREAIAWNPDTSKGCAKINASQNDLRVLKLEPTKDQTIFIIPSVSLSETGEKQPPKYEYGIVFHEKENKKGRCDYYPKEDGSGNIYHQINGFSAKDLNFVARSVTLFQKPFIEPKGEGVSLYSCLNFNREGPCEKEKTPEGEQKLVETLEASFAPSGDLKKVNANELGKLKDKTRSIDFHPVGSYFVLFFEKDNFQQGGGECAVLDVNKPNLMDLSFPKCPKGCKVPLLSWFVEKFTGESCAPCFGSMIVIKGSVL